MSIQQQQRQQELMMCVWCVFVTHHIPFYSFHNHQLLTAPKHLSSTHIVACLLPGWLSGQAFIRNSYNMYVICMPSLCMYRQWRQWHLYWKGWSSSRKMLATKIQKNQRHSCKPTFPLEELGLCAAPAALAVGYELSHLFPTVNIA